MISIHILTRRMTLSPLAAEIGGAISIHILTRRMTISDTLFVRVLVISIHILTRRMTEYTLAKDGTVKAFQSTSSHGG